MIYNNAWLAFTVRNYGYGTEIRNLRFWPTVTRYGRKKMVRPTIRFSVFCTEILVHVEILHGVPGWFQRQQG
jgi:hypothetical protein